MSSTKADLRNRALEHLGVLAAGESPSAEDAALVDGRIDSLHEKLMARRLVNFETSAIPDEAVHDYMRIVANECAQAFGLPRIEAETMSAEAELRKLIKRSKADGYARAVYY